MPTTRRRLTLAALLLAGLALLAWTFRTKPQTAELGRVRRGPLEVLAEAEGRTRVRERYVVAAPAAGQLARHLVHAGDLVREGQKLADLSPLPLDPRARQQAEARLAGARAEQRAAEALATEAATARDEAARHLTRTRSLTAAGTTSAQALEEAEARATATGAALEAARSRARAARFEMEDARAALTAGSGPGELLSLRAPAAGRVLRLLEEGERVVPAGAPVLEIGDPGALEVILEMLSSDAVRVRPGAAIRLKGWGGGEELPATVRLVEPAAFTKVSPLGVEEQRVNVIGDLRAPAPGLGDGFRVTGGVVLWRGDAVLKVPVAALFRHGERWAVFRLEAGRARLREVEVGALGEREAEVLAGLAEGDLVVLYPGDAVGDGTAVEALAEG